MVTIGPSAVKLSYTIFFKMTDMWGLQAADFRYLTGINQDGVAVIESSESSSGTTHAFRCIIQPGSGLCHCHHILFQLIPLSTHISFAAVQTFTCERFWIRVSCIDQA